jgi:hypothetical protein
VSGARWIAGAAGAMTSLALLCASPAHAHFTLQKPASWLNEDDIGGPQKGSPCGPGNLRPFVGDDIQPIPISGAVTTFHAGETITVALEETVYHAGYFRISLARTRAADATPTTFPDPPLTDLENCYYDRAAVRTGPHDNVLADGLFMAAEQNGENRSLTHEVELPHEPCEECTLQVMQVMEGHPQASCFYFHCADIRIVPAQGASAGASGAVTTTPAGSSDDSGGCSVVHAGAHSTTAPASFLLAIAAAACLRRRRRAQLGPRCYAHRGPSAERVTGELG